MDVGLSYGRGTLSVRLPEWLDVTVIRKPAMPVLPDPGAAVGAALARPASAGPLAVEARGKTSACILINDITRPVPNGLLLQPIVRALLAAGLPASRIQVLVATSEGRSTPVSIPRPCSIQTRSSVARFPVALSA